MSVTNLTVSATASSSITLSFAGVAGESYDYALSTTSATAGFGALTPLPLPNADGSYTISSLAAGTQYWVKVREHATDSNVAAGTTVGAPPSPPSANPTIDGAVGTSISGVSTGAVQLTTTKPNDLVLIAAIHETAATSVVRNIASITSALNFNPVPGGSFAATGQETWGGIKTAAAIDLWWAVAPTPLAAVSIQVNFDGAVDDACVAAVAINGLNAADLANPQFVIKTFDQPGSGGVLIPGGAPTTSPTTMMLAIFAGWNAQNQSISCPLPRLSGWTEVVSVNNDGGSGAARLDVACKAVTAVQSALPVGFNKSYTSFLLMSAGVAWGSTAPPPPPPPPPTTPVITTQIGTPTNHTVVELQGTGGAGDTVKLFADGGTLVVGQGVVASGGTWDISTNQVFTVGTHVFTATATNVDGVSSPSAGFSVPVAQDVGTAPSLLGPGAPIAGFVATTDNFTAPWTWAGYNFYNENAGKSWSLTSPDPQTIRVEIKAGELWADDGTRRDEVLTDEIINEGVPVYVEYEVMFEPGPPPNVNIAWLDINQIHQDDNYDQFYVPFGLGMNGNNSPDVMDVTWRSTHDAGNSIVDANHEWTDAAPLTRGQWYQMQWQFMLSKTGNGYIRGWRDGVKIVDYVGNFGYGVAYYWKMGLYTGWGGAGGLAYDLAVNFRNWRFKAG